MCPPRSVSRGKEACLKTKLLTYVRVCWYVLTEVPGWPDAPVRVRIMRALPIALPLLGIAALFAWRAAILAPNVERDRAALQPLEQLEADVAALQVSTSDQQVSQLRDQAKSATAELLETPDAVPAFLETLKSRAVEHGWIATFQASPASDEPAVPDTQIRFLGVRARLKMTPDNQAPLTSLLALLEGFSAAGKRIDLTRLAIRADDVQWQAVELHLRLACSVPHAKIAQ